MAKSQEDSITVRFSKQPIKPLLMSCYLQGSREVILRKALYAAFTVAIHYSPRPQIVLQEISRTQTLSASL